MTFKEWLYGWLRSLLKLLGKEGVYRRRREMSYYERGVYHARNLAAKRRAKQRDYKLKRRYRGRRSSYEASQHRFGTRLFRFAFWSLAFFVLPISYVKRKIAIREEKQNKKRETATVSHSKVRSDTVKPPRAVEAAKITKNVTHSVGESAPIDADYRAENQKTPTVSVLPCDAEISRPAPAARRCEQEDTSPISEDTPKSNPKNACDQYIRKRMIIAGSSYCDSAAFEGLGIGSYVELAAEPSNPHDADAISLLFNGNKIGYVARKDSLPFVTALKLGRRIYGVITDINDGACPAKYEYEAWFDKTL